MQPDSGLRRNAMLLAAAGAIEFGLQAILPILLVRRLDASTFGQYRLLWLMANTALSIAPAFMPSSLFYFLPRTAPGGRGLVLGCVLAFCLAAGAVAALITSGWNPWMQESVRHLFFDTHGLSSAFMMLWIVASVAEVLPTADGRVGWQAQSMIGVALLRTLLLAAAALTGCDIIRLAIAIMAVAACKLLLLLAYLARQGDLPTLRCEVPLLRQQLAYALPFALGNALFLMRAQGDQWIVISLLTPAMFATFSVASVVQPVSALIRQPVINAMMPRLNAAHARGAKSEIASLIARSNGAAGMLLLPVLGGLYAAAPALVRLLYTDRYQDAAPVMQVYLVGMAISAFAVGHVLPAIGKGRFAALSSLWCLCLSIALGVLGLRLLGLPGAALGSVCTLAINELWSLRVIAASLGVPMQSMLAWRALGCTLAGTAAGLIGATWVGAHAAQTGLPMLLLQALVYLLLFLPAFLLSGGRRQFDSVLGWRPVATLAP
jgi:O-antigen/teichoic acid export membrane protein